ncbi:hypothetical protein ACHWQZ_G008826 [Mnemiopsis leidyi]
MDYHTWKLHKNRIVTALCLLAAVLLTASICIVHWAQLTLPKHQYRPKIGDYVGPSNISTLYLGLFTTSHGSYYTLFKDVNREEIRKVNIVSSMLLLSLCSVLLAAVTKMLAPTHCHLAKRYKGPALLCVLASLEFISCRRLRRGSPLDPELMISPTPSEESDEAPLNMTPDTPDQPPPYQDLD